MLTMIVLAVFAGFGALSVLWAAFGCLLPSPGRTVLVHSCGSCGEAEMMIRRHRWLLGLGALRCPLILVDGGLTEQERSILESRDIKMMTRAELMAWSGQELDPFG